MLDNVIMHIILLYVYSVTRIALVVNEYYIITSVYQYLFSNNSKYRKITVT